MGHLITPGTKILLPRTAKPTNDLCLLLMKSVASRVVKPIGYVGTRWRLFPYQLLEYRKLGKAGAAKPSKRHSTKVEDSGLTEYQQKRASLIDTSLTPIRPVDSPDAVQEQNKERVKKIQRILILSRKLFFYFISQSGTYLARGRKSTWRTLSFAQCIFGWCEHRSILAKINERGCSTWSGMAFLFKWIFLIPPYVGQHSCPAVVISCDSAGDKSVGRSSRRFGGSRHVDELLWFSAGGIHSITFLLFLTTSLSITI